MNINLGVWGTLLSDSKKRSLDFRPSKFFVFMKDQFQKRKKKKRRLTFNSCNIIKKKKNHHHH